MQTILPTRSGSIYSFYIWFQIRSEISPTPIQNWLQIYSRPFANFKSFQNQRKLRIVIGPQSNANVAKHDSTSNQNLKYIQLETNSIPTQCNLEPALADNYSKAVVSLHKLFINSTHHVRIIAFESLRIKTQNQHTINQNRYSIAAKSIQNQIQILQNLCKMIPCFGHQKSKKKVITKSKLNQCDIHRNRYKNFRKLSTLNRKLSKIN